MPQLSLRFPGVDVTLADQLVAAERARSRLAYPTTRSQVILSAARLGLRELERTSIGWRWRCDVCGEPVSFSGRSYPSLEWYVKGPAEKSEARALKLVHTGLKGGCSFHAEGERPPGDWMANDLPLISHLEIAHLLDLATEYEWDDQMAVTRMAMRLTQFGYEQTYRHIRAALSAGAIEVNRRAEFIDQSQVLAVARWMRSEGIDVADADFVLAGVDNE